MYHETKAAYRFFDNDRVTTESILAPHIESTISQMHQHSVVFLLQDTTTLNFTGQKEREDIGPINHEKLTAIALKSRKLLCENTPIKSGIPAIKEIIERGIVHIGFNPKGSNYANLCRALVNKLDHIDEWRFSPSLKDALQDIPSRTAHQTSM